MTRAMWKEEENNGLVREPVDDVYDGISVGVVAAPVRSNTRLAT